MGAFEIKIDRAKKFSRWTLNLSAQIDFCQPRVRPR
jgi:hypothetical protein